MELFSIRIQRTFQLVSTHKTSANRQKEKKKHKLSQKGKKLMNKRGQTQLLKGNVLWNRIT